MFLQRDWLLADYNNDNNLNLADRILCLRGYETGLQREAFYKADMNNLHDPFLFKDMKKACETIIRHGRAGNLILVHGDYDADGLTSTALLIRALNRYGFKNNWIVPDRLLDGYGLSDSGVDSILESGASLVITVDCGIASISEIDRLNDSGIEVIVTDHHECRPELPRAVALLNPKIPDCGYPFAWLAGVGVTLKLVQALDSVLGGNKEWRSDLPLAALGTVADVVPLIDENRIIVRQGVSLINNQDETVSAGICAMLDMCQKRNSISSSAMGFTLAPRLNAAGRMGDIEPALRLLLSDDPVKSEQDAKLLNELNRQRQILEQEIMQEAVANIEATPGFSDRKILVAADQNWHPGVIGIVCSRLVEQYNRPVILLAGDNGTTMRGSCRTCGDFDILAALEAAAEYTINFGGHKKAAGLEVSNDQLQAFADAVNEYAAGIIDDSQARPALYADMYLDESDLTLKNAESLSLLEPYGEANRQPLFVALGFQLIQWKLVGNGRHVKLSVAGKKGHVYEGIAFGMSEADELFKTGDMVDLLFSLEINEWQGRKSLQLQIRDLRHSLSGEEFSDKPWLADSKYRDKWSLGQIAQHYDKPVSYLLPQADEYKAVYQYIKTRISGSVLEADLHILARRISASYKINVTAFKLARIIDVFSESRLVKVQWLEKGRCRLTLLEVERKVKLEQAPSYQRLQAEGDKI
ncbi:MAG: single-stranded-DNA-specific exonuclease [Clostridiales bacterium]|nr:single-stranded-DNA-specific exonuclease [Clostridiales bacterium]